MGNKLLGLTFRRAVLSLRRSAGHTSKNVAIATVDHDVSEHPTFTALLKKSQFNVAEIDRCRRRPKLSVKAYVWVFGGSDFSSGSSVKTERGRSEGWRRQKDPIVIDRGSRFPWPANRILPNELTERGPRLCGCSGVCSTSAHRRPVLVNVGSDTA